MQGVFRGFSEVIGAQGSSEGLHGVLEHLRGARGSPGGPLCGFQRLLGCRGLQGDDEVEQLR